MIVSNKIEGVEVIESTAQIYMDFENVIEVTKELEYDVDYAQLLSDLKVSDTVNHAVAFSSHRFFKQKYGDMKKNLVNAGFKTDQVYPESRYTKNFADTYLVATALSNALGDSRLRRFVLVSDDGGYLRMIKILKRKGIFVTLIGSENCSLRLKKYCDEFIDLKNYRLIS